MWFNSDVGRPVRWLWVGMRNPPRRARLYLYACSAGERLCHFMRHCVSMGHSKVVPMPSARANDVVMRYLDEVDRVLADAALDPNDWKNHLAQFLDDELVRVVENPDDMLDVPTVHILRRSLGYVD